jgi:hypothetical protein
LRANGGAQLGGDSGGVAERCLFLRITQQNGFGKLGIFQSRFVANQFPPNP